MVVPITRLAAFGLFMVIAQPASAGFNEGLAAYNRDDYATALRELQPLAEHGDARAEYYIGCMYLEPVPGFISQETALKEQPNRTAAVPGEAQAAAAVADAFNPAGHGPPGNYAEANRWFRMAAEKGYAKAMGFLGVSYFLGRGVSRDVVEAHKWLNLSAALAKPDESYARHAAVEARKGVAAKMTPDQIAEAQKRASEWMAEFEKRNKK